MTISSISPNTASAITPFNPLGKQTVGEEGKDSKNSTFKAVEESAQSARGALRQEGQEVSGDIVDSIKDEEQQNQSQQNQQSEQGERDDGSQQNEIEQKEARQEMRQQAQEQEEIRQLASRDREVRNHERAHSAVGGQYAGAASYQFKKGPDGINYAVSGEVSISTGSINNDPQATISKAQTVRNAALAPADPSPQDRRVAANATQMEMQARQDLIQQRREEVASKDAQKEGQEKEPQKTEARSKTQPIKDERDDNRPSEKINEETSRRILSINSNYLSLLNDTARLGSVVSEAV